MFILKNMNDDVKFYFRIIFSTLFITIVALNSFTNFAVTDGEPNSVMDYTHIFLKDLHNFLENNRFLKCLIMIIIGLVLDASIIIIIYLWIKKGKTWRPIVIIGMFSIMKILTEYIFTIKYPDESLWEFPGFPSLLISYKKTNNLFFCGLIGINLILAVELDKIIIEIKIEYEKLKYLKILSFVCYGTIILQIIFDMSIRSHYIIDEFTGLIIAHFCIIESEFFTNILDRLIPLEDLENENTSDEETKYNFPINVNEVQTNLSVKMII